MTVASVVHLCVTMHISTLQPPPPHIHALSVPATRAALTNPSPGREVQVVWSLLLYYHLFIIVIIVIKRNCACDTTTIIYIYFGSRTTLR